MRKQKASLHRCFVKSNCRSILFLAPSCATKVTTKSTWIVSGLNYFSLLPSQSAARGKANKRVPTCWTIKVVFNRNKSESPQNVNFDRKISPSEKPNKSNASAAGIGALGRTKDEKTTGKINIESCRKSSRKNPFRHLLVLRRNELFSRFVPPLTVMYFYNTAAAAAADDVWRSTVSDFCDFML